MSYDAVKDVQADGRQADRDGVKDCYIKTALSSDPCAGSIFQNRHIE